MNALSRGDLWQRLRDAAMVDGDVPAAGESPSPWYVRTMLGAAGWLGALFLFGFVAAAFEFVIKSAVASLALGAICCVGAYAVFRALRNNVFATQFGLAASLAGQVLIIIGLNKLLPRNEAAGYTAIFALEAVLAGVVPNFIHCVMTTWGAMFALSLALARFGAGPLLPAVSAAALVLVWLDELRWARQASLWQPVGYGLALGLVQLDANLLWGHAGWFFVGPSGDPGWLYVHAPWIGRMIVAAMLLGAVAWLMKREGGAMGSRSGIAALGAAVLVAAASWLAPGVSTALLIVLLGFAAGNRVLLGLGLFALAGFLFHYYYRLDTTLLAKSMVLAGIGTTLLLARMAVARWLAPDAEEPSHA